MLTTLELDDIELDENELLREEVSKFNVEELLWTACVLEVLKLLICSIYVLDKLDELLFVTIELVLDELLFVTIEELDVK